MVWDYGSARSEPSRPQPGASSSDALPHPPVVGEMTLRAASKRYGVSTSTLQSWCRKGLISARKAEGRWLAVGDDIQRRVALLGLDAAPAQPKVTHRTESAPTQPQTDGESLLVPRDAWDKMLEQLGNLHEAGQQLAEARERAVKAETEARFLRERLSEIRRRDTDENGDEAGVDSAATDPVPGTSAPITTHTPAPTPPPLRRLATRTVEALRRWRRG